MPTSAGTPERVAVGTRAGTTPGSQGRPARIATRSICKDVHRLNLADSRDEVDRLLAEAERVLEVLRPRSLSRRACPRLALASSPRARVARRRAVARGLGRTLAQALAPRSAAPTQEATSSATLACQLVVTDVAPWAPNTQRPVESTRQLSLLTPRPRRVSPRETAAARHRASAGRALSRSRLEPAGARAHDAAYTFNAVRRSSRRTSSSPRGCAGRRARRRGRRGADDDATTPREPSARETTLCGTLRR